MDCKLIGRLPTTLPVKEHLVSTKVIPRIAFTPGMTRLPQAILEKMQSAIAETIWKECGGRGAFSLLCWANPTEATQFVLGPTLRSSTPSATSTEIPKLALHGKSSANLESSLHMQFSMACATLDIEWLAPFQLSLWSRVPFYFLAMSKADIRRVLQKVVAHRMYSLG